MISLKKCSKVLNKEVVLKDISLDIKAKQRVLIQSKSYKKSETLFKILCNIYDCADKERNLPKSNKILTILSNILITEGKTVSDLIKDFSNYYRNANVQKILDLLFVNNISNDCILTSLSMCEVKFVYFVIAMNVDVEYVFLENLFLEMNEEMIKSIKESIESSCKTFIFIDSCNLDDIITNFIYIKEDGTAVCNDIHIYDKVYHKYVIGFADSFDFSIFNNNDVYINYTNKSAHIICFSDNVKLVKEMKEYNPIYLQRINLTVSDLYLIGEKL